MSFFEDDRVLLVDVRIPNIEALQRASTGSGPFEYADVDALKAEQG